MTKRFWWKGTLLVLATGTTLALSMNGCLGTAIQRILVAVAID